MMRANRRPTPESELAMTQPTPAPEPPEDAPVPEPAHGRSAFEAIDLRTTDPAAVNSYLRQLDESAEPVKIVGAAGQAGLATGLRTSLKVRIEGNVGAYFALLNAGGNLEIAGDVGPACGHSMTAGDVLVRGHAGDSLAAFACGGFIGVHGTAGQACGLGLGGADVVVRQSVGAQAAYGMRAGNLVLGSDAGDQLGEGCTGGTIYLRGNAASIASNLREVRMRESDAMRLGLLLVRAGIKSATREFRVYRPRG